MIISLDNSEQMIDVGKINILTKESDLEINKEQELTKKTSIFEKQGIKFNELEVNEEQEPQSIEPEVAEVADIVAEVSEVSETCESLDEH